MAFDGKNTTTLKQRPRETLKFSMYFIEEFRKMRLFVKLYLILP